MLRTKTVTVLLIIGCVGGFLAASACDDLPLPQSAPKSASGVKKVTAKVEANADLNGKKVTTEQWNIATRYDRDDDPTATKHLYVVSAFSGDCILYSTVRGKVTSSGKRLSPYSIVAGGNKSQYGSRVHGIPVAIGGRGRETAEVLQDDGTYGSSIPYLYWFDARGVMHKHYVSGGQIIHVSDTPMTWPKIVLNLEDGYEPK